MKRVSAVCWGGQELRGEGALREKRACYLASVCLSWFFMTFCGLGIFDISDLHAADWEFSPSISFTEEYDDNILFTSSNRESDFVSTAAARLLLSGKGQQAQFSFDSTVAGLVYAEHGSLDTVNNDTRATLGYQWTPRFSTELNASFVKDSTLESQLLQSGIATRRADRYRYDVGLSEKYAFTPTVNIQFGGTVGQVFYPDGTYPDTDFYQFALAPSWIINEKDTLSLSSTFSNAEYNGNAASFLQAQVLPGIIALLPITIDRTSKVKTLTELLVWERPLGQTLSLKVGAGYRFTWIENSSVFRARSGGSRLGSTSNETKDDGLALQALLKKDWTERLSTTLAGGRDSYTTADARTYDHNYVQGSVNYGLSELIVLRLAVGYDINFEASPGDEEVNYVRVAPSIEWKLTRTATLILAGSYEYETIENLGNKSNADRFRTSLALAWQWPRLWANH